MPVRHGKEFLIGFAAFALMDLFWFSFFVKKFNLNQLSGIGRIENGQFDLLILPAIFVYLLMSLGFIIFILPIDVAEINGTFVAFVVGLCGLQKVGLRAFSSDASVAIISATSINWPL